MSIEIKTAIESVLEEINEALNFMHAEREAHAHEIAVREAKISAIAQCEMALRHRMSEVRNDVKDGKYF